MTESLKIRFHTDAVFCISIHDREDRRELIRQEFSDLDHEIEFILVERDQENPERGCFNSHIKCAKLALERNYNRILILEDDATFIKPSSKQLRWTNSFLNVRNPELLYLGGVLGRMWMIPFPHIVRCRLTGTHAYILSKKACEKFIQQTYSGIAIDSFYCKFFRAYSLYPMVSQQQPETLSQSDITDYRNIDTSTQVKDEHYWSHNFGRQKKALMRNWFRTLCFRFL